MGSCLQVGLLDVGATATVEAQGVEAHVSRLGEIVGVDGRELRCVDGNRIEEGVGGLHDALVGAAADDTASRARVQACRAVLQRNQRRNATWERHVHDRAPKGMLFGSKEPKIVW